MKKPEELDELEEPRKPGKLTVDKLPPAHADTAGCWRKRADKPPLATFLLSSAKLLFFTPPPPTMSKNQPASAPSTSLERALEHNVAIQDTVEQSAAELCLINTVLKHEVPGHVQTGEVAQALQKTDELESRIQASADDLAQVNDALKQEISARAVLERQLASTQAALEQAQDAAQEPSPNGSSQDFSRAQSATR